MNHKENEHNEDLNNLCFEFDRMFHDGTKVNKDPGLAMGYADWALREGYSYKDIRNSFALALDNCHAHATDAALSKNDQNFKYELTSTVHRARERLEEKCKKEVKENTDMKNGTKPSQMYKRNPELNEKLDEFMRTNPKLVNFYNNMDKAELVRKACLQSMKRKEWEKRQELAKPKNQQTVGNASGIRIAV